MESGVRGDGGELGLCAFRVRVWMGGKSGQDVNVVGLGCTTRCSCSVPSTIILSPLSCFAVLKYMFCLVAMLRVVVKYTWCACDSVLKLSQRPSHACASSFVPSVSCIHTMVPPGCRADRLGARPNNTWYGVQSLSARVAVQFLSHVACHKASPQRNLGKLLE